MLRFLCKNCLLFLCLYFEFGNASFNKKNDILSLIVPHESHNDIEIFFSKFNQSIDLLRETRHDDNNKLLHHYKLIVNKNSQLIIQYLLNLNIKFKIIERGNRRLNNDNNNKKKRSIHHHLLDLNIRSENLTKTYYTIDQIYEWLNHTKNSYKDIVDLIEIGKSLQNRSLLVMKIGYAQNRTKKLFWFDSGIHAREWTTISTSLYTIDKILIEQSKNNSLMNKFLKYYDIYFLVLVNPDGYQFSLL
ncbi:unnamed protein product, partial [Brachionus calyciflorus]